MDALRTWFKSRLSDRPDSEHGQALVRLVIAVLILAYLSGLSYYNHADHVSSMMLVMMAESLVGMGLMAWILIAPERSDLRRCIGMAADYGTLGTLMTLSPSPLAPLYVLILWVTIGNGLRYGTRYLYTASALGSSAFLFVIIGNPYWRSQIYLSVGLLLGLIAIPAYLSSLLHSLQRITEEAKRANAAKSRFLATMSHEFRSPLNGIIGMAELMQGTRLAPDQREYAEVIHTSAQTLKLLVDDVLDISAIEAGKLQRRDADFNLYELIRRLETMLAPQAAAKGLRLRTQIAGDVPRELHGEGAYLTQILLNLLHNAVKFTESGEVSLEVTAQAVAFDASEDAVFLRFSVRDTGVGIPEKDKQRIFDAFEQVDSGPTRRYGGTGLGTTIAKTLTQLLEGRIGLEDNPGGGSHFWVDLPMRLARPEDPMAGDYAKIVAFDDPFIRHRARTKPLRVLVADDQGANRTVLSRILERAGHRVVVVADGDEALDRLETDEIDIAVIDMHMPKVSGLDVIRQLRVMQAGQRRRTPILILSADATEQAAKDAIDAGARLFLTKPVVVGKLLEGIASAISDRKSESAPQAADSAVSRTNPAILEELAGMGLGSGFLKDFVEQCLRDASGCTVQLAKSAAAGDWNDYRDSAHALKGVAENLGASAIAERCRQIMQSDDTALRREHRRWTSELEAQLTMTAEHSRREVNRIVGERQRDTEANPAPDAY